MTGQDVFSLALAILQENGPDGTYNATTYTPSAPLLINLLLGMLEEADRIIKGKEDRFDFGRASAVSTLSDPIILHESLSRVCMPFGLASLFVSGDQPTLSNLLWQRFLSERASAVARFRRARRHTTKDVYFS